MNSKRIIFLGSSVTYGSAANGCSFADFLAEDYSWESIKEAVSGTTLVDEDESSYVSRFCKLQVEGPVDLVVCQLSTNDASQNKALGAISEGFEKDLFDTKTVAGAIEFITAYAREKYNCPVLFYTSPKYDSQVYDEMVRMLWKIAEKWDIGIIDLWNDKVFNDITPEQRSLYMDDVIHPTYTGYRQWWTPYFAKEINKILN